MLESNGHYDLNAARKAGYRLLERLDAEEALNSGGARSAAEPGVREYGDRAAFVAARTEPPR